MTMETYETNEGIIHCSNCGSFLNKEEVRLDYCSHCDQVENASDEFGICTECKTPNFCKSNIDRPCEINI